MIFIIYFHPIIRNAFAIQGKVLPSAGLRTENSTTLSLSTAIEFARVSRERALFLLAYYQGYYGLCLRLTN